jgi:hypothetical protein
MVPLGSPSLVEETADEREDLKSSAFLTAERKERVGRKENYLPVG